MKIRSAYVNRELDFDVMEKLDPNSNQTMLVIKHDSLRDVVYNQLNLTNNGSVEYSYIKAEKDHAVVECTIDDGKGRVVKEVGEAVPETLNDNIARSYPTLIASQRAFDRAAILLLRLAGKQLSNGEMGEFLSIDFEPAILKDTVNEEMVIDNNDTDNKPFMNAPITVEDSLMNIPEGIDNIIEPELEEPVEVPEPAPEPAPVDKEARIKELGDTVFGVGKYKDKPDTIAQIYKSNPDFFRALLRLPKPAESLTEALKLVREYIELVG